MLVPVADRDLHCWLFKAVATADLVRQQQKKRQLQHIGLAPIHLPPGRRPQWSVSNAVDLNVPFGGQYATPGVRN